VRRWRSWYRWATLAMLAHAFLVVAALAERTRHPAPLGLIPLTCNEIQHLFAALLVQPADDRAHRPRWSAWRRRHQAHARTCHYRRQAGRPWPITVRSVPLVQRRCHLPESGRDHRQVRQAVARRGLR
jgi:hypothetical protein